MALMGENGAGKSTLMKCMFGIYKMDEGEIANVLFENPSLSRLFLCILQSAVGKRIAFMPPSRKFLQKFPHHRRMTQP